LVIDHGPAGGLSVVSGDAQTVVVGSAVGSALVVAVTDAFGNAVDGESVTYRVSGGGGGRVDVVAGGSVDSVGVSDVLGRVACQEWVLDTLSGVNTAQAQIGAGASVAFTATGSAGTGVAIDVTPTSKPVTVGSGTVVTAVLKDQYGNVVGGERVDVLIGDVVADGSMEANGADANPTYAINAAARYGTTDSVGAVTVVYRAPSVAEAVDSVDAFGDGAGRGDVTDALYTSVASGATDLRVVFVGSDSARAGETFSFRVEAVERGLERCERGEREWIGGRAGL
jgi:hypothetical protein